jgi:hypothetical protein
MVDESEPRVVAADVTPKGGDITYQELRDFVIRRTGELTNGRQHPQLPFLDEFDPGAVFGKAAYAR